MKQKKLLSDLAASIRREGPLAVFASRRAKFEGWLKVKTVAHLQAQGYSPIPEVDYIDIVCAPDWAIQLKTTNTNYRHTNVRNATRPITKNISEIIEDIRKLKALTKYKNRAVLFVVFPCKEKHPDWAPHLARITPHLSTIRSHPFVFSNGVPAIAYFGEL